MKATIKGTLLEKFIKEGKDSDGKKTERSYLRIYQPGEKVNLDVLVGTERYSNSKVGQPIELQDITVGAFNNGLYARE